MCEASIYPAPWMGNASPSSLGSTGKGHQQQPSQGGMCSDTSQRAARARARACGSFLVFCPPCSTSHPRQASEGGPAQGIYCIFCLEPVGDSISYHTMLCPVCKQAHFHRGCIQVGALPSPCRYGWCSPGPDHAHTACASTAEIRHECWHYALSVPRLC